MSKSLDVSWPSSKFSLALTFVFLIRSAYERFAIVGIALAQEETIRVPDISRNDVTLQHHERVIIIGAGPTGLTAGYELAHNRYKVQVLKPIRGMLEESQGTVRYKGFRFDIGGHRFYSKNPEIEALWTEFMGNRMRTCSRLSRIYYRGRFFKYPLEPFDALRHFGPIEAIRCL